MTQPDDSTDVSMASIGDSPPSRIEGAVTNISYDRTLAFFQERAERANGSNSIAATSYQDGRPNLAEARDESEWRKIRPHLGLASKPVAIDIGCGVGRFASHLSGHVSRYFGIDFSAGLLEITRRRVQSLEFTDGASVQLLSAADISRTSLDDPGPFELVIVSGVLAYLNDSDLRRLFDGVCEISAESAVVYVREPVGRIRRLTLVEEWSDELSTSYSAIYRTASEYRGLFQDYLGDVGFEFIVDEPLDPSLENRSETTQHFFVMKRTAK